MPAYWPSLRPCLTPPSTHRRRGPIVLEALTEAVRPAIPRSRRHRGPRSSRRPDPARRRRTRVAGSRRRVSAPARGRDRRSTATTIRIVRRSRDPRPACLRHRGRERRAQRDRVGTRHRRPPRSGRCFTTTTRRSRRPADPGAPQGMPPRRRELFQRSAAPSAAERSRAWRFPWSWKPALTRHRRSLLRSLRRRAHTGSGEARTPSWNQGSPDDGSRTTAVQDFVRGS